MALNAYLKLKGQKQGQVRGSCTQKGREDSIIVNAVSHDIISPRDPHSGLPTGHRQHRPIVITKALDRSSPVLYAMLTANENIPEWELRFWTPQLKAASGMGTETQHYSVKLTNANIASIRFVMADNRDADQARLTEYEEVAFTYQKIAWTWTDGGIMAQDDWESPV